MVTTKKKKQPLKTQNTNNSDLNAFIVAVRTQFPNLSKSEIMSQIMAFFEKMDNSNNPNREIEKLYQVLEKLNRKSGVQNDSKQEDAEDAAEYEENEEIVKDYNYIAVFREIQAWPPAVLQDWTEIFESCRQIYKLAPWKNLNESKLIAIEDPITHQLYFCSIMGLLNQDYSIMIYNEIGLNKFLYYEYNFAQYGTSPDLFQFSIDQNGINIGFVPEELLFPIDQEIISKIKAKSFEKKLAVWPMIHDHTSGFMPWMISSEQGRLVKHILANLLLFLPNSKKYFTHLRETEPMTKKGLRIVKLIPKSSNEFETEIIYYKMKENLQIPSLVPQTPTSDFLKKIQTGLKNIPRNGDWEIDLCLGREIIQNKEERPYFPAMMFIADSHQNKIIWSTLSDSSRINARFYEGLLQWIQEFAHLPRTISYKNDDIRLIFHPIATILGIELKRKTSLPIVTPMIQEYLRYNSMFPANGEEDEEEEDGFEEEYDEDEELDSGTDDEEVEETDENKDNGGVKKSAIFQLKVTLKYMKPPVWRRLLIPAKSTFEALHNAIQDAMEWENEHLHEFEIPNGSNLRCPIRIIGKNPDNKYNEDFMGSDQLKEHKVRLYNIFSSETQKIRYIYDFGDNWVHDIVLEKILESDSATKYPCVIKTKGKCPSEDSGGVWGNMESDEDSELEED